MHLPDRGMTPDQVRAELAAAGADDVDWRGGRGWSLVYDSPAWHAALVDEAAAMYSHENALSHSAFPSCGKFESEVVAMAASVVAPGVEAFGVFTSGGTESIMSAVKAYRDVQRGSGGAVTRRRMVLPVTAHPAYWKAADYLGLSVTLVPVGPDGLPAVGDLIAELSDDVAMVGLSAPCFPYGVVDPIAEVGAEASVRGIGVHVDAAMGGLFLPFLDAAGAEPVRYGLDVPGVTSVSVDLHKYGYGAKGASVLLFARNDLRHASYYVSPEWPGGAYAASGVVGTRPVGAAAAAWTAMSALGQDGYRTMVAGVMETARQLQDGMRELGLELIGAPPMGVFAVTSPEVSVVSIAKGMSERGWWIDMLDTPRAMHFVTFPRHAAVADQFLADLRDSMAEAGPASPDEASGMSYGVMVRGGVIDDDVLRSHLDKRFDGR